MDPVMVCGNLVMIQEILLQLDERWMHLLLHFVLNRKMESPSILVLFTQSGSITLNFENFTFLNKYNIEYQINVHLHIRNRNSNRFCL